MADIAGGIATGVTIVIGGAGAIFAFRAMRSTERTETYLMRRPNLRLCFESGWRHWNVVTSTVGKDVWATIPIILENTGEVEARDVQVIMQGLMGRSDGPNPGWEWRTGDISPGSVFKYATPTGLSDGVWLPIDATVPIANVSRHKIGALRFHPLQFGDTMLRYQLVAGAQRFPEIGWNKLHVHVVTHEDARREDAGGTVLG